MVDIKGMDKARVLKALYENSHLQGMGFMQASGPITVEHCAGLLEKQTYFDYLYGRVLKVELSEDEFDERLYDRDCGEGAAQRAVDSVRVEREGGENAAGNADEEKKEPSLEEQAEMTEEAVHKILDILKELPPPCFAVACMTLKMALGPMGGMSAASAPLMMGGPFAPPFRTMEMPFGWPTGRVPRERFG
ncbi:hypothetical protein D1159_00315 [Pseudoflavonifractor sp. 524-17]|uniref:hypothetical protein n=1 Tax=Pseudoflavonifractor sp. 524-17 TaxID=2304577 RepID=UPI00137B357B|nr:hypothetical protein [Pseudoflavonifractor sp. 524-17]NCE63055.1 hypothetical protein [Pseudoflavonifractor sp. 524-17]